MKILVVLFFLIFINIILGLKINPNPNPKSTILFKNARFVVLTPEMIRMEYSPSNIFENEPTYSIINRNLPTPIFNQSIISNCIIIETSNLKLNYCSNGETFSEKNLKVDYLTSKISKFSKNKFEKYYFEKKLKENYWKSWNLSTYDNGNLFGTIRTLDGAIGSVELDCRKLTEKQRTQSHCELGLISTDGFTLIDDTNKPLFDLKSSFPNGWFKNRTLNSDKNYRDFYFLGYGLNFKKALFDFSLISGKIPLPPKFSFGIWFSKYRAYGDVEFLDIIRQYNEYKIPLDVMVVDMDWHITFYKEVQKEGCKDQAGLKCGWTGFTFDKNLFPYPKKFLDEFSKRKIKTTFNIHPASGIQPHEEKYIPMAKAMGIDPSTKKYVPFDIEDEKFANNWHDIVLEPLRKMGITFWWLDYQQGEDNFIRVKNSNPTFSLNHNFYNNFERIKSEERPIIFHRFPGLGGHRYQIGFSGDTLTTFVTLKFQIYFTATASNVLYSYWSHDIGGHQGDFIQDGELFTRWVQRGSLSPIFRTHSTKIQSFERRFWMYPYVYFSAMKEAIYLRYQLLPYIYSFARKTYDNSRPLIAPMYYDYPLFGESYNFKYQYLFGENMLISPIDNPSSVLSGMSEKEIFVPEGNWFEFRGEIIRGPKVFNKYCRIDEIPIFVKEGSIIPMKDIKEIEFSLDYPLKFFSSSSLFSKRLNENQFFNFSSFGKAQEEYKNLVLLVFPNYYKNNGEKMVSSLYEDNGDDKDYENNFSWQDFSITKISNDEFKIEISPPKKIFVEKRNLIIRMRSTFPAKRINLNGKEIKYSKSRISQNEEFWNYEGKNFDLNIFLGEKSTSTMISINVKLISDKFELITSNFVPAKIKRALDVKLILDGLFPSVFQEDYESVINLSEMGFRISSNSSSIFEELNKFDNLFENSKKEILNLPKKCEECEFLFSQF